MILIAASAFGILAAVFIILIAKYVQRKNDRDIFRRMRRHKFAEALVKKIAKPLENLQNKPLSEKLELTLHQAGINFTSWEFAVSHLILALFGGILIYMLTINFALAILFAVLIVLGSWIAVAILVKRRKNSFSEQLGDCLITVANALRAGYKVIAREMEPPIGEEFAKLTADIKMGVSMEVALNEMDKRIDNADFTLVITAVLIQREVGGNLAQILDTISNTIIERIKMKREINALTAQGKFSAMVLLALPFALGIFMFAVNPSQIELFFSEPIGQMAVAAALMMDLIGFLITVEIKKFLV